METALYYTLSTIAQTLAGTLATLVAVVLFARTVGVHLGYPPFTAFFRPGGPGCHVTAAGDVAHCANLATAFSSHVMP